MHATCIYSVHSSTEENLAASVQLLRFPSLKSPVPQEHSTGRNQAFLWDLNNKPKLFLKESYILGHVAPLKLKRQQVTELCAS